MPERHYMYYGKKKQFYNLFWSWNIGLELTSAFLGLLKLRLEKKMTDFFGICECYKVGQKCFSLVI